MPARILVVEDNVANLELMTYLLRAFGHEPITATDGQGGYEAARVQTPDLIVCDIQLPKMDGYEVARKLKAHPSLRRIPLVAVTAFAMVGDRDQILAAGFDGYIPKPIEPEAFVKQVDGFLPATKHSAEAKSFETSTIDAPAARPKVATILLVDDVAANLSALESILQPFGYCTVSASDSAHAMALARQHRPDLILSDLHMPTASGRDLLRAVKVDHELRSIPFVIISSTGAQANEEAAAAASGAVLFIRRPIDPELLLEKIAGCLLNSGRGPHG